MLGCRYCTHICYYTAIFSIRRRPAALPLPARRLFEVVCRSEASRPALPEVAHGEDASLRALLEHVQPPARPQVPPQQYVQGAEEEAQWYVAFGFGVKEKF